MIKTYYRQLYRRLVRLPLDLYSLNLLRLKIRFRFQHSKSISTKFILHKKQYDHAITVMDSILVKERYLDFGSLLDLVYKFNEPHSKWIKGFLHTKYMAFKPVWPQIHLIEEFGDECHIKKYHNELRRAEPCTDFLLMKELNLAEDADFKPLLPIKHEVAVDSNINVFHDEMLQFYKFLSSNFTRLLSGLKLQRFEVFYGPNPYGYPQSVNARENILKAKINYMKSLITTYVPMKEADLKRLIKFIHDDQDTINPAYYKYMILKRKKENRNDSVSFLEKKYGRHKLLIPDERMITFYYRQYIVQQFYRGSDNSYSMSSMRYIYD